MDLERLNLTSHQVKGLMELNEPLQVTPETPLPAIYFDAGKQAFLRDLLQHLLYLEARHLDAPDPEDPS